MRLVVLIDADNVPARHADELMRRVRDLGEPIDVRAYGGLRVFGASSGWTKAARKHAITPLPQVSNVARKNVADIALVIGAMDILAAGKAEGFCLATDDSDFTALAARIRREGLPVYGFGCGKMPAGFMATCRAFYVLGEATAKPSASPAPAVPATKTPSPPASLSPSAPPAPSSRKGTQPRKGTYRDIAQALKKHGCGTERAVRNKITSDYHKSPTEIELVLTKMKEKGLMAVDAQGRVTWA